MVKKFDEFIEEVYKSTAYHDLQDLYGTDADFRNSVDSGSYRVPVDSTESNIKPNTDEVFYGELILQNDWKTKLNNIQVTLECFTDNPKIIRGTLDKQEILDRFKDDNIEIRSKVVFAKVSAKRGSDKRRLVIDKLIHFYDNRDDCEYDMIETLKNKRED